MPDKVMQSFPISNGPPATEARRGGSNRSNFMIESLLQDIDGSLAAIVLELQNINATMKAVMTHLNNAGVDNSMEKERTWQHSTD